MSTTAVMNQERLLLATLKFLFHARSNIYLISHVYATFTPAKLSQLMFPLHGTVKKTALVPKQAL